ncbi:DUF6777 domain-containing protein [Streptomyces sp. YS415]|uniref:DUF6777 domain-containing protein n=1 Tax=Streptomyces sp. YS415 TaxID=2944806 RepID=UPI002021509C|nr:DUF6777 domain-containing protein [Streptomyces sp. YS415]MCL7429993.1 hypothetical protein [Streptomyces sp. YS415]
MRTPTGTLVTAGALATALLVTGCGSDSGKDTAASGEVFLQPVAAQGPDPFTDSTATSTATPPPVTRTPQSTPASDGVRAYSGSTPGLYSGTERVGSCDVDRQIGYLTADQGKARAFAGAAGISRAAIPQYLRGLAPVVLRADTRVTNHGYRAGRTTGYQSVLQAGTAVLVDKRGVPRVRCACGNPLKPPAAMQGSPTVSGRAWAGYRPAQVVVVTPAPQVITDITIINTVSNTWIERRIGHDVRHDRPVPRPEPLTPGTSTPSAPSPDESLSPDHESTEPSGMSTEPSDESTGSTTHEGTPEGTPSACATPTVTVTPGATEDVRTEPPATVDCPGATVTATPPTTEPQSPLTPSDEDTVTEPSMPDAPELSLDASGEIGPQTVPDTPDLPDAGGLIPDAPEERSASGSIFGSPTDVFTG